MADISLNLDTTKTNIPNPTVVLRQGDSQYQSIRVTVSDNYTPVDITTAVITFMGTTPGGTKIVDTNVSKTSDTGVFDYTFPSQAGSTAGTFANAYFKISDGEKLGSTASFTIQVLDSIDMTQAEASDYVSVVDGVIKTTVDQVNSDIQTATSQLSDKVTQANSAIDSKVSSVGAQIDSQIATATEKLNQTIATGNYASQDYVQQTVTSGINAIQKVANASHADVADSLSMQNGATNINNLETWNGFINHGTFTNNGDVTVNGVINSDLHGVADRAKVADVAKSLNESGGYKVATVTTTAGTNLAYVNTWGIINHGYATFDDLTLNGQLILPANQNLHYAKTVDNNSGLVIEMRRFQNVVSLNVSNYASVTSAWNWVGTVPPGYKPVTDSRFYIEVNGNKLISAVVGVDGHILITSIGTADGKVGTVWGSTTYFTADDMPG